MSTPPLLSAQSLNVHIGRVRVCDDLMLELAAGQSWALLGRNGVGKTTLLHTLCGLRMPQGGGIRLQGRALKGYDRRSIARAIGLLLQDQHQVFEISVAELVASGRYPHLGLWRQPMAADQRQMDESLHALGLEKLARRDVRTLSGGERQRVYIARLLCQQADLLIMDEPLNHLDLHQQLQVLHLLEQRVSRGVEANLMSLHDVNLAIRYCSHVLALLGEGEWVAGTTADVLDTDMVQRLYRHPMQRVEYQGRPLFIAK